MSRPQEVSGSRRALLILGVHSPALHPPHTQSTFLRSLRLPAILIASPHLGGISTTIASYESLLLRGYSISAVLCLHQPYYQNHEFLTEYFADRGIPLYTVNAPPEKYGIVEEDRIRLGKWYEEVESISEGGVAETVNWLEREHEERIGTLGGMAERTLDSVWWPFTQHGIVSGSDTWVC
jgi:dethiobiotin synthetase/adenosylmethionine--8-amino-7-oxononanoate aminotransferase